MPLTPKKRLGPRTVTDRTNGLAARVRCFAVRAAQSYRQGGGHKQRYRLVDFKRPGDATAEVVRLEYDPNRSAWIALVKNVESGEVRARAARDRGDGGGHGLPNNLDWWLFPCAPVLQLSYILAPKGIDAGDKVQSGDNVDIKASRRLPGTRLARLCRIVLMHSSRLTPFPRLIAARKRAAAEEHPGRHAGAQH